MTVNKTHRIESGLATRAKASDPQLLAALEQLLGFPQNQDSTELKLLTAIMEAQRLVHKVYSRDV
jgi:hypothetical protein